MAKSAKSNSDVTNVRSTDPYQTPDGGGVLSNHLQLTDDGQHFLSQIRYQSGPLEGTSFVLTQNEQHTTAITTSEIGGERSMTILLTNDNGTHEITIVGGDVTHTPPDFGG
jgi:hypothetical protein